MKRWPDGLENGHVRKVASLLSCQFIGASS
jgi:hypothetical protein